MSYDYLPNVLTITYKMNCSYKKKHGLEKRGLVPNHIPCTAVNTKIHY